MRRLRSFLLKPTKGQMLLVCAALGAAVFFMWYGVRTLDVGNESWIWPGMPETDIMQNYAGWMAYRNSPWAFPLSYTNAFCWPDGTLISYTDSNPLVSVLLKLASPLLPATFQFYGWFTLLCYVLQGVAAGLLMRLYTSRPWQVYAGALLFCFSPIMAERAFRHTQLAAHFLILFALYLYITMRRQGYARVRWQFVLLNFLAVGLHPYFLPMVMAILLVAVVEYAAKTRRFARAAGALGLNVAAALFTGWLFGNIGWQGSTLSRSGFGEYSMNLNAPFNPASAGYQWSYLLGGHPQREGQYDGFNYLGFGVLLFLAVLLLHWLAVRGGLGMARHCMGDAWRFVKRHTPLLLVAVFLTLFAVSNIVVLHNKVLLAIPLPQVLMQLCGIFRASGRLFYPVYYILYLFVVRYLLCRVKAGASGVLLAALVALQLADLAGVVGQKHAYFAAPPEPEGAVVLDEKMAQMLPQYDTLIVVEGIGTEFSYRYMALAAKYGLVTNMGRVNSGVYPQAAQLGIQAQQQLLAGQVAPGTVYVARDEALIAQLQQALEGLAVEFYFYENYCFIFPAAG